MDIKVCLPRGFTATKHEGYFWDTVTQELYSLKQGGVLRCLKINTPNIFNNAREPYYATYRRGNRRRLYISYLKGLKAECSEIPIREEDDNHYRERRSYRQPCEHSSPSIY